MSCLLDALLGPNISVLFIRSVRLFKKVRVDKNPNDRDEEYQRSNVGYLEQRVKPVYITIFHDQPAGLSVTHRIKNNFLRSF